MNFKDQGMNSNPSHDTKRCLGNSLHLFLFYFTHVKNIKLEKAMATHSITLAWRIPWREEPGGLQSMGSRRVGHD